MRWAARARAVAADPAGVDGADGVAGHVDPEHVYGEAAAGVELPLAGAVGAGAEGHRVTALDTSRGWPPVSSRTVTTRPLASSAARAWSSRAPEACRAKM